MDLPSLNRRRLLIGLAAASTAAATPALASIPASAPTESPELIRLGDKLPAIAAELDAATAADASARALAEAHWPAPPAAIVLEGDFPDSYERDVAGNPVTQPGARFPRSLWTTKRLDQINDDARRCIARKRRPGGKFYVYYIGNVDVEQAGLALADLEHVRDVAAAYEADVLMVRTASGFATARARLVAAVDALEALTNELLPIPERTMAGVIIKAQALAVWDRVPRWRKFLPEVIGNWSGQLAASILRIAEAQDA